MTSKSLQVKMSSDMKNQRFHRLLLATIAEKKNKEEAINDAIAGTLRKRDEKSDDRKVGVVPHKELVEIKEDRLKNRILYCNSVCLLTTVVPRAVHEKPTTITAVAPSSNTEGKEASGEDEEKVESNAAMADRDGMRRNVMVLSWLTPVNNEGAFVCALHKRHFTAECLRVRGHFALSVPVQGMEAMDLNFKTPFLSSSHHAPRPQPRLYAKREAPTKDMGAGKWLLMGKNCLSFQYSGCTHARRICALTR